MILICPSSNMMNWTPLVSDPIKLLCILKMGLRSWHNGKESACWCKRCKRRRFIPSLGWADPLKEEMATHSIILAWRISWTEETGRLHTVHEVTESDPVQSANTHTHMHARSLKINSFFFLKQIGLFSVACNPESQHTCISIKSLLQCCCSSQVDFSFFFFFNFILFLNFT